MDEFEMGSRLQAHRAVLRALVQATKTTPLIEELLRGLDNADAAEHANVQPSTPDALMALAWMRAELHWIATGREG